VSLIWQLAAVPLLIGTNAFFVCAEYAIVAIRSSQAEEMRARGQGTTAAAVEKLKADMSSTIGAIQVCITLTNLMLGWIGEPAMSAVLNMVFEPLGRLMPEALFKGLSTALGFVIVTLLTVVLSELVPKAVTLQYVTTVARFTAAPVLLIMRLIRPLVWLMNGLANLTTQSLGLGKVQIEDPAHTADEIKTITAESAEAGNVTPRESQLILNTLALGRRRASEIMVPRVKVKYLDVRWSMDENINVINEYVFSRLPLCDGGMDRVIGVIYTKEFLLAYEESDHDQTSDVLRLIARPVYYIPVTITLDRLLAAFTAKKMHLLCLVDEYGGVDGIVTLTDVVEELIGEIRE